MSPHCSFIDLPPELLEGIYQHLDLFTQKSFRCLCKQSCAIADPLLFSTIALDLDRNGCKSIRAISSNSRLRRHVKTLRLERKLGLKDLGDFQEWQSATIFSSEPPDWHDDDLVQPKPGGLSKDEWETLSQNDRHHLYQEYMDERTRGQVHMRELASAAFSLLADRGNLCVRTTSQNAPLTDAQSVLDDLDSAISKLPNLTGLKHRPAHLLDDHWGMHWRHLRFLPSALRVCDYFEDDMEIDALQLFLVLRAVALHSSPARRLRFAELYTGGIAFWSSIRLRHLLDWMESAARTRSYYTEHPNDLTMFRWIKKAETPSVVFGHLEELTRQLCTVEQGFARVTNLNWVIYLDGDLPSACRCLARILRLCENLKTLQISLRYNSPFYEDYTWKDGAMPWFPSDWAASRELLPPWATGLHLATISNLELSIAASEQQLWDVFRRLTGVRHIGLQHVAIIPDCGCWDSLIRKMSEGLQLTSVKLFALEDIWPEDPRLIMDPDEPGWKDRGDVTHSYAEYESNIVDYMLRRSTSFPALTAAEFFE